MIRIEKIASLVTKDAKVVDIGTDHAYLPIYLYEHNITKDITASDISENVLEYSKANLRKANLDDKIKLKQSDGFKNLEEEFDEAIIAGMGTSTIINILNYKKLPNSLIISTHNDLYELRKYMMDLGYKIIKEIIVFENRKYYDIIKYEKGREVLSEEELYFGKSHDKKYLDYLKEKYQILYKKSNNKKYQELGLIIEKILDSKK